MSYLVAAQTRIDFHLIANQMLIDDNKKEIEKFTSNNSPLPQLWVDGYNHTTEVRDALIDLKDDLSSNQFAFSELENQRSEWMHEQITAQNEKDDKHKHLSIAMLSTIADIINTIK